MRSNLAFGQRPLPHEGAHGPDVALHAGATVSQGSRGGRVMIYGGAGLSDNRRDGGNGGSIELLGGYALGRNSDEDVGGSITLTGGYSASSIGGAINITSGFSRGRKPSGKISIITAGSGLDGEESGSGKILVFD